jgi:hypothetical protein
MRSEILKQKRVRRPWRQPEKRLSDWPRFSNPWIRISLFQQISKWIASRTSFGASIIPLNDEILQLCHVPSKHHSRITTILGGDSYSFDAFGEGLSALLKKEGNGRKCKSHFQLLVRYYSIFISPSPNFQSFLQRCQFLQLIQLIYLVDARISVPDSGHRPSERATRNLQLLIRPAISNNIGRHQFIKDASHLV